MSVPKMSGKKAKEEKLARTAMAIRLAAVALSWTVCVQAAEPTGEQIYEQACKSCHESGESRAPSLDVLRQLSYAAILDSLRDGVMAYVGETLPDGHIEAVSLYLGKGTAELPSLTRQSCA
ncbi:MAG: cytochrome c, partial [Bryobacterales bacterium]|nr:cytochrome c [Bryobacterales bacterium]